ncbi:outer membrane receptor FepA [Serratia marcescens]|jgi:ferric enterobactin receptor|uniref:TonB-dependent siderophore receptor n=1 Tax=Serratia TaxID=613 RepID=UPI000536EC1B|nr:MULTISPECIES: TonB-dependent siderophore receptor [Serratia]KAB5496909.1 TonB-dependent siderophore receptor [Enterobacter sp. RJAL6]ASL95355.1 TonB-dependent siderophore receptor [Serratia marcescens]ASM04958.1 TonB-dependent siderophore receptor [Serratia marcescens]AYU93011.1 TonB-dependent siderophore receptor [Serratia sp. LS-1]EMB2351249.1 TonB-dependent siderophore receptor [Serratia marcescens]
MKSKLSRYSLATLIGLGLGASAFANAAQQTDTPTTEENSGTADKKPRGEDTIVVTAARQNLQAPGVSTITADEIKKRPPARDISELIRTMPGVNLTGNSTSGQRGNNRQIDIRGMGPENTLILIDGKPASSRNSVRQGWRGERDSRGDTAWVPPEMIERIEVLRGPAAARYGNGAAGGVVNIITKKAGDALHGSLNGYFNVPQHKQEGATKRTDFSLSGPLSDSLSFRLFGGYSKTQADAWDINESHKSERVGAYANSVPAGREGVVDKNIDALLHWDFAHLQSLEFEYAYGRQGNLYAGDTQNTNTNALVQSNYGKETNRIYRETFGLTHRGAWDNGVSTNNYVQFERTRNTRLNEGLAGGTEGIFDTKNTGFGTTKLDDFLAHSEVSVPFELGVAQTATLGTEWSQQRMKDGTSTSQTLMGGTIPGMTAGTRSPYASAHIFSLFAEDNIELTDTTMLTPGLRYDLHSESGNNWSPALNLSQELGDYFTLKMGIARSYKAPTLFQTNGNYLLYSKGQGCAGSDTRNGCYLLGNDDLKAETSVNKEIGLEFHNDGWLAGVTYFRNDYHNKIEAGNSRIATSSTGTAVYQWENVPKAVVQGLEGSLNVPVSETVTWSNNATYMIENKNKTTGDYLSVIPKFTVNSTLSWQATQDLSMQSTLTWYGRQKPKKYNYQGKPATGGETREVSPYAVVGASATYDLTKNVSLTAGIDNLFDKRQFRAGNAQNVGDPNTGAINIAGAGAATYNEPGRTYYMSINTHF